jgi:hypothetical protein
MTCRGGCPADLRRLAVTAGHPELSRGRAVCRGAEHGHSLLIPADRHQDRATLLPIVERALGAEHPDMLATRNLAYLGWKEGR